jgi:hypothetical protein
VQLSIGPENVQRVDQQWLDVPLKATRLPPSTDVVKARRAAPTAWAVQVLDADDLVVEEIEIADPLLVYTEYQDPAKSAIDPNAPLQREEIRLSEGRVGLLINHPENAYRLRVIERQGQNREQISTRGDITLRRKP